MRIERLSMPHTRFAMTTVAAALMLAAPTRGAAQERVRVITTIPDLAAIAKAVGGDLVEVESIARGYQDPHYVEAKPSYVVKTSRADLVLYVGMQLEIGWLPLLLQGSRNPDLQTAALSEGIDALQVPEGEVSRRFGDIHPEGNPHYWLDPRNGSKIANHIATHLKEHLPGTTHGRIDENLQAFTAELERRIPEWELRLAPWRGLKVVAYHQQFEYFCAFAGWEAVEYIEEKPGVPPSPRHIAELERKMGSEGIGTVISSNFIDPRIPGRIAERAGAVHLVLPASVEGERGIDDYFDLFDYIVTSVEESLPGR